MLIWDNFRSLPSRVWATHRESLRSTLRTPLVGWVTLDLITLLLVSTYKLWFILCYKVNLFNKNISYFNFPRLYLKTIYKNIDSVDVLLRFPALVVKLCFKVRWSFQSCPGKAVFVRKNPSDPGNKDVDYYSICDSTWTFKFVCLWTVCLLKC